MGDLGYFDEKYNIHIVGRIKNQINKGGEKISPKEIEEYLADHPYIEESIVAPIPDEILGEKICAFIKAKKDIAILLFYFQAVLHQLAVLAMKLNYKNYPTLKLQSIFSIMTGQLRLY